MEERSFYGVDINTVFDRISVNNWGNEYGMSTCGLINYFKFKKLTENNNRYYSERFAQEIANHYSNKICSKRIDFSSRVHVDEFDLKVIEQLDRDEFNTKRFYSLFDEDLNAGLAYVRYFADRTRGNDETYILNERSVFSLKGAETELFDMFKKEKRSSGYMNIKKFIANVAILNACMSDNFVNELRERMTAKSIAIVVDQAFDTRQRMKNAIKVMKQSDLSDHYHYFTKSHLERQEDFLTRIIVENLPRSSRYVDYYNRQKLTVEDALLLAPHLSDLTYNFQNTIRTLLS